MKKLAVLTIALCLSCMLFAQTYQPNWESLDKRPVPQWFRDAKFGIFIHWGVYSVPGFRTKGEYSEWYENGLNTGDTATINYHHKKFGNLTYYQLADQFKAELFNPDEWAQLIEKSGARYVVLTSKHHDGFALWPSKEASATWGFPWNAVEAGPHRDLLGDLFTALRKTSVHPGLYYSLYEWYNPLWLKDKKRYVDEHEWPQAKDVINTYKPDVFWTDGEWDQTAEAWKSQQFLAWMYNESPVKDKVVTYDRWGDGVRFKHGGVYTPEYQPDVNFADHYWEESRGMGMSYGYNRNEDAWDYNTPQALVLQLIDKVSGGGNFLLDIGPDEHGKIPPIMQERLLQMGDWMKLNNEAIYNTVRWRTTGQWSEGRRDYKPASGSGDLLLKLTVNPEPGFAVKECFFTYNPTENNLYAILPKWPSDHQFVVHDLALTRGTKIELLEGHTPLQWEQQGNDVLIHFPEFDPNKIKSAYAFVVKISNTGAFAPASKVTISYPAKSLTPMVSIDAQPGVSYYYTLDGTVPTEAATLYSKPFAPMQSGMLSVRAFKQGVLSGNIYTSPLTVFKLLPGAGTGSLQQGLQVSTYKFNEAPSSVSDLDNVTAIQQSKVSNLSVKDLPQGENAGLIYKGYIKMAKDGIYNFYTSSDDGSKLWIDDSLVVNNDGLHANTEQAGKIALKKGYHAFKLAYIQEKGGLALSVQYAEDGTKKQPLAPAMYYTEK